jgi:hypothetical protein
MQNVQALELMRVISSLPPDKVAEVKDFALFLRDRYLGEGYSDEWSDEDMLEFSAASLAHFESTEMDEESR